MQFKSTRSRRNPIIDYLQLLLVTALLTNPAFAQTGLDKQVTITPATLTIKGIIEQLEEQTDFSFVYSSSHASIREKVTLEKNTGTVSEILADVGNKTALNFTPSGNQVIVKQVGLGTVRGNIKDHTGNPVAFATVRLKGSSTGATANANGEFTLNKVPEGARVITIQMFGLTATEKEVRVVARETTILPEITLQESIHELQEVIVNERLSDGYKIEKPSSSLRIATSIMETPQSIITVSRNVIEDQQLLVMTDVAKNVSGVTSVYPDAGVHTDFAIRGTRAITNRLRNGMPTGGWLALQEDMSYVENVEFIKGPAGFMLAQGEPGGMFNVVTKKPLEKSHASASLTMGSYALFRTAVDIGGLLNGKKLFYRLNVMGQKSGTHIDYGKNNRFSLAPVIRYEFNEKTSVTVEYNLDLVSLKATLPLMPTVDHKPLPRNFMIDDPGIDPSKYSNHYGLVNLQHRINDNWRMTAQFGIIAYKEDNFQLFDWGSVDADGMLDRFFRYVYQEDRSVNGQVFLNGDVNTGKINHKLLIGFDGGFYENKLKYYTVPDSVMPINVYKPEYGMAHIADTLIDKSSLSFFVPAQTSWQAVSVMDNIKLLNWLQLNIGGRYTYYQSGSGEKFVTDHALTPRVGLLIQPLENTSLYALYDQSFIAQPGVSFTGERFKPLTGNNIEFGVKREWFNKKLLTQVAVFNITKNNALTGDPVNFGFSIQRGQVVSKGLEIDVTGAVNRNLSVVANYAYTDAKITKDTDSFVQGTREAAPLHVINTWAKYETLNGALKGIGIGFGISYHKDRYMFTEKRSSEEAQVNLPDLTNLNGALYYKVDQLSFALNVDNLANAYNYIGYFDYNLGTNGEYRMMSLPGRNYRFSVSYKF